MTPTRLARAAALGVRGPGRPRKATLARDLMQALAARLEDAARVTWPSARWRGDPVGFARDVLGVQLTRKQRQIVEALASGDRVAVRAGRKVGKSELAAVIALWYFCSFPDARVLITAPTYDQVKKIVWRSIKKLHGAALLPLDGTPAEEPFTGLRALDFREIHGHASTKAEAIAGISGANLCYIVDEASGVPDFVFEAILGNLADSAGACKLLLIGNPTRSTGYYADCFEGRQHASEWIQFQISAHDSPNVTGEWRELPELDRRTGEWIPRTCAVPGLAGAEWIERMRREYGEESPFFQIHVLGNFARSDVGRVNGIDVITRAQADWDACVGSGVLHIGLDPAGPGDEADETAVCVRRGNKVLALRTYQGLDRQAIWLTLQALLHEFRAPHETPIVVLDAGGAVGEPIANMLSGISHRARQGHGFTLVCVRANRPAQRQPTMYGTIRDELAACLAAWLREGGTIPSDPKLAAELNAPSWYQDARGRSKVQDKLELRKMLGRSPDRCDALALAVWPSPAQIAARTESPAWDGDATDAHFPEATFSPWAELDAEQGAGGLGGDWAARR